MGKLSVSGLGRRFGAVRALADVSFEARDGEFLTLLGPSGCGKSTTLFSVAGLERPDEGRIVVDETVFVDAQAGIFLPPERRGCGLVFQSYALWPHMTVVENVAFPLRLRRIRGTEQKRRVAEMLELVEMAEYGERLPHELSGGQQQRVALARTLVYQPQVLLLDEPLSNLDAKLRLRARGWLKQLQTRLGVTTIYVTHDQSEALSLSDRIAVMDGGRIMQLGTPHEIYFQPASSFIADFVGHSNFLRGRSGRVVDGLLHVTLADGQELTVPHAPSVHGSSYVVIAIRPEHIRLRERQGTEAPSQVNLVHGRIVQRDFLGARYQYLLAAGADLIRAEHAEVIAGDDVFAELPAEDCIAFAANDA